MCPLSSINRYSHLRCCLMFFILITANYIAYGQSKYGLVISNSAHLSGAIIRNTNSHKLSISNSNGEFSLTVSKGDTILTSYMGFKTDTMVFNNQNSLLITLNQSHNLLNEVVIRDNPINPLKKFRRNQEEYKQIYRIGDNKNIVSVFGGAGFGGVGISIDKLYSALSREGKNARRLQRALVTDYKADIVDARFTKSLVTKITGYTGERLDIFMIDNRPTYEFVKNAPDYDLIKYIRQKLNNNAVLKDTTLAPDSKQDLRIK
ncbi:CarboxypepD_reg-like domain-containing protein [Mucilaginibacter pineti]|uniref:CarboxypepD_reg-like domain-containing protein n=1 Tax=Mucilaginibacter pineti TaxID=1391627 RepID=A0A1G6V6Y7_9SPHI|nr:carboxypeptidase-like regulatory domain-containing protein [Mucilaginibacter pineti]SDD48606.1 CarboxypepD_reg-like domain-containing protein [Mucilaginibacter pineti]